MILYYERHTVRGSIHLRNDDVWNNKHIGANNHDYNKEGKYISSITIK